MINGNVKHVRSLNPMLPSQNTNETIHDDPNKIHSTNTTTKKQGTLEKILDPPGGI